ncbi:MAG TPA: NAD(P)H-dependent oxidoreductase [Prolixibacteraceae bacterium]|nr:NAD(P)H-dependent oxidoreductase [Prolixibacteraceae bacterium]
MKITIVDGSPSKYPNKDFTLNLASGLIDAGHNVKLLKADQMKINYCQGCWSCWWKTPGECPQKDDMPDFYRSYIASDMVIHFSPMSMGFISSKLKTINDRTIPLVHPYIAIVNKECHHFKRYEKYPFLSLIVDPMDSDDEDLQITKDLYKRLAINLKSELKLFATTEKTTEELINEISHI